MTAAAHAEDRGFITDVSYDIQGIVPTADGAVISDSRNVHKITRDGEVQPFLRWSFQIVRMAASRDGLLFIGRTEKVGDKPFFDLIFKTDLEGKVLWARRVYAEDADQIDRIWIDAIAEEEDGSIIAAGSHRGAIVVLKLTADGTVVWRKRVAQSGGNLVRGIVLTRDGGVLVIGAVGRYGVLLRLSRDGSLVDNRVFARPNGTMHLHEAVELPNGDFFVVGAVEPRDTNDADALLMRVNAHGSIVWQKTMAGGWGEDFTGITANGANRFDILGHTFSFGDVIRNWLVTVDANGNVTRQITVTAGEEVGDSSAIVGDNGRSVWAAFRTRSNRIARITNETKCDAIAETSVPMVAATALFEVKRALEIGDEDARVEPDEVEPQRSTHFLTFRECPPTVGPLARLTAVPPQPEREEIRFLVSVSRMLAEKKFAQLDALAAKLRKNREQFDSGEWKLAWFYQAFQPESRPLITLGTDRVERLVEQWVHTTNSSASRTALASFELDVAWRVRGSGYWNSVVKRAGEEFERRRRQSIEILEKLDEENQCDVHCLTLSVDASDLGGWSPPLRKLVRIEPTYSYAFGDAATYLRPEWGGSYEELRKFAREAADATRLILGDALYAVVMDEVPFSDDAHKIPNYDWDRFRSGLQAYQRAFPKSSTMLHELAYFAWRHADQKAAREAFENPLLQWDRRFHRWSTRQQFERVKAWALGPPAPPPIDRNVPSLAPPPPVQPSVPPPAPEPPPVPKKPRGRIVTNLDVVAGGKSFATVAFVIEVGPRLYPTAILWDATEVAKVAISQNRRRLRAVAVPTGPTVAAIVTLPDAALPVESLRMTAAPPANEDQVAVVGCRVVRNACEEFTLFGRVASITKTKTGSTMEVTGFSVRVPFVEDILVTGAPVLESHDLALGIVRSSFKVDNTIMMNCESLPVTLQVARTTVPLRAK